MPDPILIESGVGDVWQVKQPAWGAIAAANAAGTVRLKKVGDDGLAAKKVYSSEAVVDGSRWAQATHFVDTIGGAVGTVTAEAQIETGGFAFAQVLAVDVVTGAGPDYTHTITSGNAAPPPQTFRQKTGLAVGPWRNSFWDALIGKLTFNCGQDQKVAHIAQDVVALHAGDWFTGDPAAVDSGTDAFNWNEAYGTTTIDGVAFPEIDGETLELDTKVEPYRGNGPRPIAFEHKKGEINRTMSAVVTDQTLVQMKQVLYNAANPADATAVASTVKAVALESTYVRSATRSLKITTPKVIVKPDDWEVFTRAEGGKIPVAFGGQCQPNGASPAITVVAKTADATPYV